MKISNNTRALFVVSREIGEDNILWGLLELSVEVTQSKTVVDLNGLNLEQIDAVAKESLDYDFVISRNFSVNIAEACHTSGTPYISWCYDSPVITLYRKEALYPNNYVFVFDKRHLERLKELGLKNVYYQPLAANMAKAELVCITGEDISRHICDVSFVGSMYNDEGYKRFYQGLNDEYVKECEALFERHLCKWDGKSIFGELSDDAINAMYKKFDVDEDDPYNITDRYITELMAFVSELTSRDRVFFLDSIGKEFNVTIHTREPEKLREKISATVLPPLDLLGDELFRVYASAKINLNLTMRSIETGIPQRVFDIMSIGGCVFSNYQQEAAELFEPDREIVLFGSIEEFKDKAGYYLAHEKERLELCYRGHLRVAEQYNYQVALRNMIEKL